MSTWLSECFENLLERDYFKKEMIEFDKRQEEKTEEEKDKEMRKLKKDQDWLDLAFHRLVKAIEKKGDEETMGSFFRLAVVSLWLSFDSLQHLLSKDSGIALERKLFETLDKEELCETILDLEKVEGGKQKDDFLYSRCVDRWNKKNSFELETGPLIEDECDCPLNED